MNSQLIKNPFLIVFDEDINPSFVDEGLQKWGKGFLRRCKFLNRSFFNDSPKLLPVSN